MRLLALLSLLFFVGFAFADPPAECDGSIKCLKLTWDAPTHREDGTLIESLDGYKLYHTASNVFQGVTDIAGTETEYYVVGVAQGTHTFTISAVETGLEGEQSAPASLAITQAKIGPMTLTIEVL